MNRHPFYLKKKAQRGFTLIELGVVVAIIGILVAVVAPSLLGTTDGAKSQNYFTSAHKISSNWMMLTQSAGVSTTVASNPVVASGKTVEDVLFDGRDSVASTYVAAYNRSKILPLSSIGQKNASGTWEIDSAPVTITGGGTSPLRIQFSRVPESIVLLMVQKYQPSQTTLAAAGATVSAELSYGAVSAGGANVVISKAVN